MAGSDEAGEAGEAGQGGFLSRWSRRKVLVRHGVAPPEPAATPPLPAMAAAAPGLAVAGAAQAPLLPALADDAAPVTDAPAAPSPPAPTLADVALLDHQSDFSRFVAPGVDTGVKNAALKKLFTDPHFNVMDRLDTYIDDYGKPDPLPEGMLRQMVQSQFLGLFSGEAKAPEAAASPALDGPATPSAAAPTALPETSCNEDPALRLQPLDAVGPAGPDPRLGPDTGRQH